ncbi:GNAT family N-acetyltransferase [Agarivorans sp. MS3-6]|uniref:GNAT family N-acetyltransferase n=1 Tax=Agarivorans sp. TSD2052 TaxID=2937286 RepID=UPI00200FAE10|nr:GNAT family N-acetyltransferase [Agarivorans sp. TSD2052]UPW19970.1 GNAT family N-acetyltransferase [Agarivorans sp. TSD2052]
MTSTVYYLEQTTLQQLKAKPLPTSIQVCEVIENQALRSEQFYREVGQYWQWTDKLIWSALQWQHYTDDQSLRTFGAFFEGQFVGYFELYKQQDASVEIAYFGLAKPYLGQGLGGSLLTRCIETAWQWQAKRVWVHTCDLDHPSALANYQARGMTLYKTALED